MQKLFLIIVIFLAIGLFWYINYQNTPSSHYLNIVNLQQQNTSEQHKILQIFQEINYRNSHLKTLKTDVVIDVINNPFNLKGTIHYEKDLNFRMFANSVTGKELDIGSTPHVFWFWSKRMKPPDLYYAEHVNLHKTRLKTPFHPLWMIECLSVGVIKLPDKIMRNDQYILIEEKRISDSTGKWIKKITLIDTVKKTVIGHYLVDLSNNGIASAEVLEFQVIDGFLIPKKFKLCWYEENKILYWTLYNTSVNHNINSDNWIMPYMKKINMAEN